MAKILLTPEKAAEVLSIGRTALYELLRAEPGDEPKLPWVKIGKLRRIAVDDDLRAYAKSLRQN